jgi:uncharacterized DUF497 family protein
MKLTFEWDEVKARENLKKHKVAFDEDMRPEFKFSDMKGGARLTARAIR